MSQRVLYRRCVAALVRSCFLFPPDQSGASDVGKQQAGIESLARGIGCDAAADWTTLAGGRQEMKWLYRIT